MKNILFLTAYSPHSRDMYQYALKLALQFKAGITLCYMYKREDGAVASETELAQQTQELKDFVKENTARMYASIPIKVEIGTGDFLAFLLNVEKAIPADLIVMGMTRNRYPDRVFGSLSSKILKQSQAPVLLIPPGSKMEEIEKITYASYLNSADDEQAMQYLTGWSKAFSAAIDVLYICEKHHLGNSKKNLSQLQDKITKAHPTIPFQFELKEGKTTEVIKEYREFTKADLLVLSTHRSGFWAQLFESGMTRQIANETRIPILILKQ